MFSRSTWAVRLPPCPGSVASSSWLSDSAPVTRFAYLWNTGTPLYPAVLEPVPQGVSGPGERAPAAGQAVLDGLHVRVERRGVLDEGLAEAAADVQHARGQAGRAGLLEQSQALVGRLDLLAGLAGVQVEGESQEVHRVRARAQQVDDRRVTRGRHAEPAAPAGGPGPGAPKPHSLTRTGTREPCARASRISSASSHRLSTLTVTCCSASWPRNDRPLGPVASIRLAGKPASSALASSPGDATSIPMPASSAARTNARAWFALCA